MKEEEVGNGNGLDGFASEDPAIEGGEAEGGDTPRPARSQNPDLLRFAEDLRQEVITRAEGVAAGALLPTCFTALMIDYLAEAGELEDAEPCSHKAYGIQVSGYALSENEESLDLLVAVHTNAVPPRTVTKREVITALKGVMGFFNKCRTGYWKEMEESGPAFDAAQRIYAAREKIIQVRFILITDGVVTAPPPKDLDKTDIRAVFQVWDIERLFRFVSSGRQRESVEIDFVETIGQAIPCLAQPDSSPEYASYLAIFPGRALVELYGRYGARLLERNVRSFLQARGKINAGMRQTIRTEPHMFLAFNNGLSVTAQAVDVVDLPGGGRGIRAVRDLQIVNGGQTTASIYHAVKKDKADVSGLFVQVKLTVLNDPEKMDAIVPLISRFANSQNKIQEADLAANDAYHRAVEECSRTIWAPPKDGSYRQTRWFYERARGQYKDELARAGTPKRMDDFRAENPPGQLFTKTDLAKAVAAWERAPHVVSRGAQSCFVWFMQRLDAHKETEGITTPDERYFKRLAAKLILFRNAERIMKELQYAGYRANLVAYTVARLVHETDGWLDLSRIWQEQCLHRFEEEALRELSRDVWSHITNVPGGGNVTQYCKREECWKSFLGRQVTLPAGMRELLLPHGRGQGTARSAVQGENAQRVMGIPAAEWFAMHEWSKAHGCLNEIQRSLLLDIAAESGSGTQPGTRKVNAAVQILDALERAGYRRN